MTDYEKKLDEIKNNLSVNRNVILTGAPGTGKTFMAKTVAARIILDRKINDFDKDLTEEEKAQIKEIFQKVAELNTLLDKYDIDARLDWKEYLSALGKYFETMHY